MSMMKAIVKAHPQPGGLEFQDVPIPEPGVGEVLLKNRCVAICGTDLHIYNWDAWSQHRVQTPRIIGHEFAAEVAALGPEVHHTKVGEYVSGEGHLVCGRCDNCRTGLGHVCYSWKGIGYDVDGVFAEYFVLPERNIWKNDPELPPHVAAVQDPLGNAIHTVFRTDCVAKTVVVFGDGPVGLLAVAILKAIGAARIIVFGLDNDYRLGLARQAGADDVVKVTEHDPVEYVMGATGGFGADVVLEIAGARASIQAAIKSAKLGGEVVMIGIPNSDIPVNFAEDVVFRSLSIYGITGRRIWDSWFKMRGLLRSGRLNVEPLVTHQFDFNDYEKGFELMQTGRCGKVVLNL